LDFVAYVVIALLFAGIAIVFAFEGIDAKWMALLFETVLVFGSVVVDGNTLLTANLSSQDPLARWRIGVSESNGRSTLTTHSKYH
jgi:hypothetical protein